MMKRLRVMADSNITNFIDSLSLSSESKALAEVLLTTDGECNDFYIGFLGRNTYIIDDLLDYRESRLSVSDISLNKFVEMCDTGIIRDVFEQTFLQSVSNTEMNLINRAIFNGKISLKDIYCRFRKNVNESILKYVL